MSTEKGCWVDMELNVYLAGRDNRYEKGMSTIPIDLVDMRMVCQLSL